MPAGREAEIRADWGVRVELAFSMGTARIAGAVPGQLAQNADRLDDFNGRMSRLPTPRTALRAR